MNIMRVILAVVVVVGIVPGASAAKLSRGVLQSATAEFNEEWRSVRAPTALLQLNYIESGERSFAYFLPNRLIDLATEGARFRIRKISYEDNYVHIRLETDREARLGFFVFDDRVYQQRFLDEVVPRVFAEVFTFREPSGMSRFVANVASDVLHLRGCNHLPSAADRRAFDDRAAARDAGFRDCPVCFATEHILPIEGYRSLRAVALETARLKELAFPPVADTAIQQQVQRCGEAVLGDFPVELRGFDYRFKVLHSEIPSAFSLPTGFVYVTDKLMAAIEDSLELALILAHEIAHCETNRTGERPPLRSLETVLVDQYYRDYYRRLRFQEIECDILGLLTLAHWTTWEEIFARARGGLTKLQFAGEALPVAADPYATHPGFSERLSLLDPDLFHVADQELIFEGFDKDGEMLISVRAIGWQGVKLDEPFLEVGSGIGAANVRTRVLYFFLVKTDQLLNESVTVGAGRMVAGDKRKVRFKEERLPFPIAPGESALMVLTTMDDPLSVTSIAEMKLDISDQIEEWRLAPAIND